MAPSTWALVHRLAALDYLAAGEVLTLTYTVAANDGDGGITPQTFVVNITGTNDIPTLTAFAAPIDATNEDTAVAITLADLLAQGNQADLDGTVTGFVIKSVASGTLKIGADAASAQAWNASTNATVDTTNNAYWTPAANANGTLNAFTAVAKDNDGAESATAITASVTIGAVNDPPTGTSLTLTILEDSSKTFTASDFGFSDPVEGHALQAVILTTLPMAGTLTLSGVAVSANQSIALADLGNLVYTPAVNANGNSYATIGFKVQDAGGITNGGVDTSLNANTQTVNVTAVNDAPVFTTTNLSTTYTDTCGNRYL